MGATCGACRGFTLPEMLVVVTIIGILAGMVSHAVVVAQRNARQTECKSSLRQFGVAIQIYRGEYKKNPPWLSNLYPDYIDDRVSYTCRSDKTMGKGNARPDEMIRHENLQSDVWPSVNDNENNGSRLGWGANHLVQRCSFFYEFSMADSPWQEKPQWPRNENGQRLHFDDDETRWTWCDWKENQLRFGDDLSDYQPYSESRLPIIRCYHHWADMSVDKRPDNSKINEIATVQNKRSPLTLNVAYAGNVYIGPLMWELTPQPGDNR